MIGFGFGFGFGAPSASYYKDEIREVLGQQVKEQGA